jgi:hypothetical protein
MGENEVVLKSLKDEKMPCAWLEEWQSICVAAQGLEFHPQYHQKKNAMYERVINMNTRENLRCLCSDS